ncbi:MAG: glycosyl hydrolase, partial [Planctomycetota bacterium]
MRHRSNLIFLLAAALCVMSGFAASAPALAENENLSEKKFKNPPEEAGPYTWWHWVNGNISREGITRDLEAMKEA